MNITLFINHTKELATSYTFELVNPSDIYNFKKYKQISSIEVRARTIVISRMVDIKDGQGGYDHYLQEYIKIKDNNASKIIGKGKVYYYEIKE